jgi:hypothetical protein
MVASIRCQSLESQLHNEGLESTGFPPLVVHIVVFPLFLHIMERQGEGEKASRINNVMGTPMMSWDQEMESLPPTHPHPTLSTVAMTQRSQPFWTLRMRMHITIIHL